MRLLIYLFAVVLSASNCSGSKKTTAPPPAPQSPAKPPLGQPAQPDTDGGGTPLSGIDWRTTPTLEPVLEEAKKTGKPVFIEFSAVWCGPCKIMEKKVFKDPEVYQYLNRHFLSYKVDVDAPNGKPIAQQYEVQGMPTVVFVNAKGTELERELGLITSKEFLRIADAARTKNGK
jgi:thiol:disulfide interchange protein